MCFGIGQAVIRSHQQGQEGDYIFARISVPADAHMH